MTTLATDIAAWYRTNRRDLPWRAPDVSAWGVLVSEVMLQQTPVARVAPRWREWMRRWPTPVALATSPAAEALRAWDRLGYPRRALGLHAAARTIAEHHAGIVPTSIDTLLALPGIGDYTARAVLVFAYGQRHPVVDVNVRRVLARAVDGNGEPGPPSTRRDLAAMAALLPGDPAESVMVNAGAMELGQVVCTAKSPHCTGCPLAALCAWRAAGYPEYQGPRAPRQARYEGSDRQLRGRVLARLRASEIPLPRADLDELDPDPGRMERIITGLARDGLVARTRNGEVRLPE